MEAKRMNFSKSDLHLIKWSLIAFTTSLLVCICTIWLSSEYVEQSLHERQQAQKHLVDARKQLGDVQSDLENMSIYAREYASLVDYKIIGGEQRLDWMEGLAKLHQNQLVVDFKYTIAPRQTYSPKPSLDMGNFDLNLSGLNLQLDLQHEMQLIKFFDALRSNIRGWFIIDHCTLDRAGTNNSGDIQPLTQLKADCAGGWITMKTKGTP
jgi:hypothetical protein